jgi:RimJ/RimL family protein N-acetyltransferase
MSAPALMTDRLKLVRPDLRHQDAFIAFYASDRAAARGWLRTTAQALEFWEVLTAHWDDRGFGWFVIEEQASGQPLGMCGPWEHEPMPEGEIAWSLWHDRHEGQGFAFEAATAARNFAFSDLGWTTAVSYISYDNPRSIALARRLGAVEDGIWTTPRGVVVAVYRHPVVQRVTHTYAHTDSIPEPDAIQTPEKGT